MASVQSAWCGPRNAEDPLAALGPSLHHEKVGNDRTYLGRRGNTHRSSGRPAMGRHREVVGLRQVRDLLHL